MPRCTVADARAGALAGRAARAGSGAGARRRGRERGEANFTRAGEVGESRSHHVGRRPAGRRARAAVRHEAPARAVQPGRRGESPAGLCRSAPGRRAAFRGREPCQANGRANGPRRERCVPCAARRAPRAWPRPPAARERRGSCPRRGRRVARPSPRELTRGRRAAARCRASSGRCSSCRDRCRRASAFGRSRTSTAALPSGWAGAPSRSRASRRRHRVPAPR